jgi:hypothetical protein
MQVVSHDKDKVVQLLAFFDDSFSYAEAIGFVLKGMDVFERYDGKHSGGKGRFGVRLVDAKFALPRLEKAKGGQRPEDLERPYICLDMPEFPGENDDIWIGFDDEAGKLAMPCSTRLTMGRTGSFSCCIAGAGYDHASRASRKEIAIGIRARRHGLDVFNIPYVARYGQRWEAMVYEIHVTIPSQIAIEHCLIKFLPVATGPF